MNPRATLGFTWTSTLTSPGILRTTPMTKTTASSARSQLGNEWLKWQYNRFLLLTSFPKYFKYRIKNYLDSLMVVWVWKNAGKEQAENIWSEIPGTSLLRSEVIIVAEVPDICLWHSLGLPVLRADPDSLPEVPNPLPKSLPPLLVSPVPISPHHYPLGANSESSELETISFKNKN